MPSPQVTDPILQTITHSPAKIKCMWHWSLWQQYIVAKFERPNSLIVKYQWSVGIHTHGFGALLSNILRTKPQKSAAWRCSLSRSHQKGTHTTISCKYKHGKETTYTKYIIIILNYLERFCLSHLLWMALLGGHLASFSFVTAIFEKDKMTVCVPNY